jgi:outer membrane lipoprotein-sorting protein
MIKCAKLNDIFNLLSARICVGLLLFFTLCFLPFVQAAKKPKDLKDLKKIVARYQTSPGVVLDLKKTLRLELLDEIRSTDGKVWLKKNHLRLETQKPDAALLILNPKEIWLIESSTDDGNKASALQVTKIEAKNKSGIGQSPLALLLGRDEAWGQLQIQEVKKIENGREFTLFPKKNSSWGKTTKLSISVNDQTKEVTQFQIWDDLENETTFAFTQTKFDTKIDPALFSYKPPKGTHVTVVK